MHDSSAAPVGRFRLVKLLEDRLATLGAVPTNKGGLLEFSPSLIAVRWKVEMLKRSLLSTNAREIVEV